MGRREPVYGTAGLIAEQALHRVAKSGLVDRIKPSLVREKRCQPLIQAANQRRIGKVGDLAIVPCGERRPLAQCGRAFAPGQDRKAVAADGIEQPRLDRPLVGLGVGGGGQADRAKTAPFGSADRGRRRIETHVRVGLDLVGEEPFHVAGADGCGRQDAGAGCRARDLGHGEPFTSRQRRCRVEPKPAPADRLPMLARRIAPTGQAIRESEGDGHRDIMRMGSSFLALGPPLGHALRGQSPWRAIGQPAPVPYFEVRIVAAQAPFGQQRRRIGRCFPEATRFRLDQHMGETRLQRDGGDRLAMRRDPPFLVDGANSKEPLPRFGKRGGRRRI